MSLGVNNMIIINGHKYNVMPDTFQRPLENIGGRATVYKLQHNDTKKSYALKVFNPEYQDAYTTQSFTFLQQKLAEIPAFRWVQQRYLITEKDAQLIASHPELRNAILMPWFDFLTVDQIRSNLRQKNSSPTAESKCRMLAQLLADTLRELEHRGLAHGDIANSNVLINWEQGELYIIDIEDMYHSALTCPKTVTESSSGTASYRFRTPFSSWQDTADRFAGAILISELLTLDSKECQAAAGEESYFLQDDLDMRELVGTDIERYTVLQGNIEQLKDGDRILQLLETAWIASTTAELPTLSDWSMVLGKPSYSGKYTSYASPKPEPVAPPPAVTNTATKKPITTLTKIPYQRKADSDHPVLVIFLLDLSRSMFRHITPSGHLRFDLALHLMNEVLKELINRCRKGAEALPRYHISVFGYHKKTIDLISPHPRRTDGENNSKHPANIRDGIHPITSIVPITFNRPDINAITPIGSEMSVHPDGETHMTQAFMHIRQLVDRNLHTYADSHPPYVLHITDGANNDDGDVRSEFQKLTALETNYGRTLVNTAYIADDLINAPQTTTWPGITDRTAFPKRTEIAAALRNISSLMPTQYHVSLHEKGYTYLDEKAYLFFPGTNDSMIRLAMAAAQSTGK